MSYHKREIPKNILSKWQSTLNVITDVIGVSDVLIARIDHRYLEIIQTSQNKDNSFTPGERVKLLDYYCGTVIKKDKKLLIENALKNAKWSDYPEVKKGLISYLGFPLKWPDGIIFGTLCLHDKKEHHFNEKTVLLMKQFKELIESHLETISQDYNRSYNSTEKDINRYINRFKTIYDNLEQGVCLHKIIYRGEKAVDYQIIDINPAYEKILNIPTEKAVGALGSQIYESDNPPYLDLYARVAKTQKTEKLESYFPPMGKFFNITVTSPEKGKFITLFTDITDNKLKSEKIEKSEKKYRELFNRAPVGIFKSNSKGKFLHVNPLMVKILGGADINEIFTHYQELSRDLYINPQKRKEFLNILQKEGTITNFEFKAKQTTGNHIWVSVNARVGEKFDDGSFIIDGFAFNISEKKEYENKLYKQKEILLNLNEELTAYNEEVTAMNEELQESMDKINELNNRFINMINLVSNLHRSSANHNRDFLSDLLRTAINIVPEADYGKICIYDKKNNCQFIDAIGHDIKLLKTVKLTKISLFRSDFKGTYSLNEYSLDFTKISKENKNILQKALKPIKKSLFININIGEKTVGRIILDIAEGSNKEFSAVTKKLLESFANLGSAFFSLKKYNELQGQFTQELISSIIQILEMYDRYTKGHSQHVADLAVNIAERMKLSESDIDAAYWAGMVHDLGKLLIPLNILNKEGALTDEEYEMIKGHPYWGYWALKNSEFLGEIAVYVLYHHERWDGKGYPEGLRENEIPLISQILSVVDAWDAMISKRAYRKPLPKDKAINEIKNNRGTQFSPEVVDVFIKYIG